MRRGRGLAVTAWALGLLGLVMLIGSLMYARSAYTTATVRGGSMTPTYTVGERLVFERVGGDEVRRGDVVLYSAPERYGPGVSVIQRVIGVGGDRVACCGGKGADERITLNGKPLDEPYVQDGIVDEMQRPYDPYEVKVPEGRLFLLGDHRLNARDSRYFRDDHGGTVPVSAVQGRVTEERAVPIALAVTGMLGVPVVLAGIGFGIAALVVRRRSRAVPPMPPWAVQA
ncbi:signal peptidase I [Streptomyces sp. NBC_00996]|uniref:signal peptidase I n=1 Tax=Streptomyces sp. NBC_00996 TaxID=2903710 RepID=UPI003862F819|nr:signal peptidase I [Streptomyces sp. NBC_00996]